LPALEEFASSPEFARGLNPWLIAKVLLRGLKKELIKWTSAISLIEFGADFAC
jgi:hypothetical protein